MAMSLKVIVPPHPLINHWLSILRDKGTPNVLFSTGYEQIGRWMTYEALRDWLPYKKQIIDTFNGEAESFVINQDYPIRVFADIPEGMTLWFGAKDLIPNAKLSLGHLPKIENNEGIIIYSQTIRRNCNVKELLQELNQQGIESKRILLIAPICSNLGLNEIAKLFPQQVVYTSTIDNEDEEEHLLKPGIGNPILRLSTMFHEKN